MRKHLDCGGPDNSCMVAEARGEHCRCQGNCAYADEGKSSPATYDECDPRNPARIAKNRTRYEGILRDHSPDASNQLKVAFLAEMHGKEYGAREMLDAFGWFWIGWAKSSGTRTVQSETGIRDAKDAARYRWLRDAHDCDWNKLFRDGGDVMDAVIDENISRSDSGKVG